MAEEDIYGSKKKYEKFKANLNRFLSVDRHSRDGRRKYYCKRPGNLNYFKLLFAHFDSRDLSYIRRIRVTQSLKFICNSTEKDLRECERDDINLIMADMHTTYNSIKAKQTFIKDIKYIWKILFPEKDEKGRADETIVPYPVRHLSCKIDKSREKLRTDKLTADEVQRILEYLSNEPRMQAYVAFAIESLARPQEILGRRIENVELYQNYAKIYLTEHGKEGVVLLQCIDSFPYLVKWLDVHPLKNDKSAHLFINTGITNKHKQMKPKNVNKILTQACKSLGINKPITCYSLKRNGVTLRRLRGDSDVEIQHAARWSSTKQLKTYDLSNQDEAFKIALKKRGLIGDELVSKTTFETKECPFCKEMVGFSESICPKCKHIVSRDAILKELQKDEEITKLKQDMEDFKRQVSEGWVRGVLAKQGTL